MSSLANNKTSPQDSDEIDLGRIIGEILDHRKLIIAVTAVVTFVALVYVLLATPVYQANALIQIEQKQGNAILNSLSQMLPDSQPQSAPEISLLQSRMILGKTIDDLNLQYKIEQKHFPVLGAGLSRLLGLNEGSVDVKKLYIPSNGDESQDILLKILDERRYQIVTDNITINGTVGTLLNNNGISILIDKINADPGTEFYIRYETKLKKIDDLQKKFNVADQGKDTGMLNLTLVGEDPKLIREILNSISQNYLAQNVERQAAQDAKSLEFLNEQLPKVRSDLDAAEDKLNNYRKQKDSVDLTMEAKSILDQIVNVDNQLNSLTFREAEVSQLYTKEHPTYKALMEKKKTLQEEKAKLNKRVSSMPSTQQEVLRLSRDVESGRAVYLQLLNRQQELNIAKSSAIGNVRIIDQAITEPKPIQPKSLIVVAVGILAGLFISIGIVLIKVYLRRGIESPEQLEEMGINVYASIPVSEWLTKNSSKIKLKKNESEKLLAIENPADLAVEAIRSLRTSLHFAMMEAKNNVLMISGASPNAGKTFISTNLSATIASTGKKVLFIDADLRKGYVHKMLGGQNIHGLSDVLSGQSSVESVIERIPSAEFDYIGRGQVPPNPAELLMHRRFEALLKWASDNYELVIIDTPPILAVTDAAIIGRYAGTTLLVARFEENTAKEIAVSVKRFEQSGVLVRGCILNGVVKKASSYYGYGYNHYGYSYDNQKK
ncbi:polysaccharide biosynthesis tyrosine autokinase [Klebsiella quasipneumoniae subsp. similipneumoniae]|uniref:polysaccharide biosynthesis tyrosine autokinase n=3 Tax=Klebsiella quasipneumoniae TaxID=1463165 RepID=UPI001DDDAE81|nr:polysaccharide biosynthesis tyrosine autokinase [Klebsiella quasipneumoniae]MCX2317787.1 polysaccharide biosynthesis tyrosine autokinase [Klebsiella quasipneumoniae]CAF3199431.1 Putative tyrosine-protein kinase in cps region [Klebsiella quasipneumoniae]CAH5639717.1 Putative tyrosine-protein kinase in cps region [Klebsiella quasipneumoniae]HDU5303020.1 polysaccharide biosynthesis tyrosine autokinase [Klebsiella quasipneumoniae subsp. similipneumoniae]